jgi:hypothetical protein
MYASPVSLLRLPPPRRRVNRGKFAPAGRERPEAAVCQIFAALLGQVIWGELRLRASWCRGGDPTPQRNDAPSLAGAFKNLLNLKTPAGVVFSLGLLGGGEMYWRSIHMLNFTYEDNIKIKYKQVAGISRTYYLSKETISRPTQSRETIPFNMSVIAL